MQSRDLPRSLAISAILAAPLGAQEFHFQIDSGASSSVVDNEIVLSLPSTVIGDYDAVTNPGGTLTIPGLFGGSGNNLIPMDLALTLDSLFNGATSGSFGLDLDLGTSTVSMDALSVDLLVTDQQQVADPAPGFAITNQPFPLPTILPPGATANLLLSATISQLDTDLVLDVGLVANGGPACGIESYCDSTANSTGQMAQLSVTGSLNVNDGQLDYLVTSLPPNRPGIFFMSQSTANVPGFGGSQGVLCVGAPQIRYEEVHFSGAGGQVSFMPDFGNLPQGATFLAGSTWYLQFWYRDSNPGATSNTSNGVSIRFCQ